MSIEDLNKLEESAKASIDNLRAIYQIATGIESSLKLLFAASNVEVLAYPKQPIYRLVDRRHIGLDMIRHEQDLEKTIDQIIEENKIEEVSLKTSYYEKNELFHIEYTTGGYYAYSNKYKNEDFGKSIWTNRQALIDDLSEIFAKAKVDFIKNKEEAAQLKKERLKKELEQLEGKSE